MHESAAFQLSQYRLVVHWLATAEQRVLTKCAPTKAAWG